MFREGSVIFQRRKSILFGMNQVIKENILIIFGNKVIFAFKYLLLIIELTCYQIVERIFFFNTFP